MVKIIMIIVSVVLALHGLIHLLGTAVYMQLAKVEGLPYKTTLLAGRWDLGEDGIRVFGAFWAVAAIGFIVAAVSLLAGWSWWRSVLVSVTLFSLVLTVLDWSVAYAGVVINVVILAALWFGPRVGSGFPR